jgi:hypothetical protein
VADVNLAIEPLRSNISTATTYGVIHVNQPALLQYNMRLVEPVILSQAFFDEL